MTRFSMLLKIGPAIALIAGTLGVSLQLPDSPQVPPKEELHQNRPMGLDELNPSSALGADESQLNSDLKTNPHSAELMYRLALVLRQENKPRESLEMYTRAAGIQKPDAEQLRSVALNYVLLNDYEDAIHWLQVALSIDSRNLAALYNLGRCLYTQNRFHEAEAAFTQVLALNPEHLKAEENLGLTYDAENQPEKAEQALRNAAAWAEKLPAPDPWPYLDLGAFLLDQGRAGDALPFLAKAGAMAPELAICHEKLGRALVATGNLSGGVKELQVAVKLDPANPKTHFELGRAYHNAGNQDAANREFAASKSLYGAVNHE